MPSAYFERDQRCLRTDGLPTILVDLCLQRDINSHRLLRGSGLFLEDVQSGRSALSAEQCLQLLGNAEHLLGASDSPFLLGQRLLPAPLGSASQALSLPGNLQEALELLVELRVLLSPLLSPQLLLDEQYAYLLWRDSCGLGAQRRFMVEVMSTAVVAMSRRLGGTALPWRLYFRHTQPRYIEQYWVHLGEDLHFASPCDAMRLPRVYITRAWQQASPTASQLARQQAQAELASLPGPCSLLDALHHWLLQQARRSAGLEQAAAAFAVSPSTLKRKLSRHGTSYQNEHDLARLHLALYLYQIRGYSNEQVANYLHFHDATNFRRSFKRWTGLAPSALRQLLHN